MTNDVCILNILDKQKNVQVSINGKIHSVTEIIGNNIRFEDNSDMCVSNDIAYEIADKWINLMEVEVPHIYEAPVPINNNLLSTIKHLSKKWIYNTAISSLVRNAAIGINTPEQICWNSHYNPRDNDYCDTTYYYNVVVYDNTIYDRFIQFLKNNGLYESETKTTVHFK